MYLVTQHFWNFKTFQKMDSFEPQKNREIRTSLAPPNFYPASPEVPPSFYGASRTPQSSLAAATYTTFASPRSPALPSFSPATANLRLAFTRPFADRNRLSPQRSLSTCFHTAPREFHPLYESPPAVTRLTVYRGLRVWSLWCGIPIKIMFSNREKISAQTNVAIFRNQCFRTQN